MKYIFKLKDIVKITDEQDKYYNHVYEIAKIDYNEKACYGIRISDEIKFYPQDILTLACSCKDRKDI